MQRKIFSGLIFIALLTGILVSTITIQPVEASGTIYIRSDGSIDPPTAPITTTDNVTYTFTGNINDSIVVERNNTIINGADYTLQGTGSETGIDLSGRSNVTIINTNIKNFSRGVYLYYSSNNMVSGNNITNNGQGIRLYSSSNNTVSGNNITNNGQSIYLHYSSNNTVSANNITNNGQSIYLHYSSNNTVSANNITNSYDGVRLHDSSNNNTVCGNNIANNSYGVFLYDSSNNNTVSGNNIANNSYGVDLYSSSNNNMVSGNNITNNNNGVRLDSSSSNMVSANTFINDGVYVWDSYGNVVEDNTVNGKPLIYLEDVQNYTIDYAGQVILINCNNITVESLNLSNTDNGVQLWNTNNCSITGNNITTNNWYGVLLHYSSNNNMVSGNNITNNEHGIRLYYSSNNMVSGNNITNNNYGIYLDFSSNNNITGNDIANNNYGVDLYYSSNNRFYHNNINNTYQVYFIDSFNNAWDNGCEGNYWSNYNGTDLDGDGIGDTELPWEAVDNYPLMNPYWLPGDINHDLKIDIYDVVRITGVYGSQQGDPNWNCHSDIAEPYGIINIYDVVTCTKDYRKEYTP